MGLKWSVLKINVHMWIREILNNENIEKKNKEGLYNNTKYPINKSA